MLDPYNKESPQNISLREHETYMYFYLKPSNPLASGYFFSILTTHSTYVLIEGNFISYFGTGVMILKL